jgi:hypothetical protein
VVRVTKEDYETVVALGMSSASGQIVPMQASSVEPKSVATVATPATGGLAGAGSSDGGGPIDLGLLFKTVERLKVAGKLGTSLSEYDTRAEFIDKYLEALGYNELGDVQRGSPVESGNFPDYVLRVNGKAAIAIEAKKLGAPLGSKRPHRLSPIAQTSAFGGAP